MSSVHDFVLSHASEFIVMFGTLLGGLVPSLVSFVTHYFDRRHEENKSLRDVSSRVGISVSEYMKDVAKFDLEHKVHQSVGVLPPDYWILHSALIFNDILSLANASDSKLPKKIEEIKAKCLKVRRFYDEFILSQNSYEQPPASSSK